METGEIGTRIRIVRKKSGLTYKHVNLVRLMPSGSDHIKPDAIPLKSAIKSLQAGDKSFSISLRPPDYPSPNEQRSYPSRQIQSLMMLARGRNVQPPSSSRPPHSQPRMKRKSRLILKNDRLLRSQPPEFFLRLDEITWLLRSCLEDMYIPPALVGTPIDASKTELGELSRLSQTDASDEPPRSDHPIELAVTRIPKEAPLNLSLIAAELSELIAPDAQAASDVSRFLTLDRSLGGSRDLSSTTSSLARRRSTPDADPPVSAMEPRSLSPYALPGLAVPWPVNALGLLLDALTLRLGFS